MPLGATPCSDPRCWATSIVFRTLAPTPSPRRMAPPALPWSSAVRPGPVRAVLQRCCDMEPEVRITLSQRSLGIRRRLAVRGSVTTAGAFLLGRMRANPAPTVASSYIPGWLRWRRTKPTARMERLWSVDDADGEAACERRSAGRILRNAPRRASGRGDSLTWSTRVRLAKHVLNEHLAR